MGDVGLGGPGRPPTVTVLRLTFSLVGVVAMVLGYLGFRTYLPSRTGYPGDPLDLLYYDLQLFVLGSAPLQDAATGYPLTLQVARFTAPVVTVYALVDAGRLLLAAELLRLRARSARNHAVVCGDSAVARSLANRLKSAGNQVVMVRAQPLDEFDLRRDRILGVVGDPTDPDVLRSAGVGRATVLYACTADSAVNASIAFAAARVRRSTWPNLAVYAQVRDPDLCLALRARRIGLPQPPGLRMDFFNVDELGARVLLIEQPMRPVDGRPPRLLVAGTSSFGHAVTVEAARSWRLTAVPEPLEIHLVGDNADQVRNGLLDRYPFLREVCRIEAYDGDLAALLAENRFGGTPDRVFICYDDEQLGLKTALTVRELWQGGARSVVVRLERLAGLAEAFHGRSGDRLLDEVSGKLRLYRVVEAACDPKLIGEDLVERLARTIHEHYVRARERHGDHPMANTSMVSWDELSPEVQRANRTQADDIGRKLRAIGCVLAPRSGVEPTVVLTGAEVEQLAELEHVRWVAEKWSFGWRPGRRDDATRRRADLVAWSQLPEPIRERDRDAIRELPRILADAGFQVVRIERGRVQQDGATQAGVSDI